MMKEDILSIKVPRGFSKSRTLIRELRKRALSEYLKEPPPYAPPYDPKNMFGEKEENENRFRLFKPWI